MLTLSGRVTVALLAGLFAGLAPSATQDKKPINLTFSEGEVGKTPPGWFVPLPVASAGFTAKLLAAGPKEGQRCVVVTNEKEEDGRGFGNVMQSVNASAFRGKQVRFKAPVKVEGEGHAQLWLRVDRPNNQRGFFDNMGNRPIKEKDWKEYQITGDVTEDAETINFGMMLIGGGKASLGPVTLEVVGAARKPGEGHEKARPLSDQGLENLVAFTRLLGYVRYFHPSDQAADANWDLIAIEGVLAAEKASTPDELARILHETIRPYAPSVLVYPTGKAPARPKELAAAGKTDEKREVIFWYHLGAGQGGAARNIYNSQRVTADTAKKRLGPNADKVTLPRVDEPFTADLGGGISCSVPLALFKDDKGTLPHADKPTPKEQPAGKPEGFQPSGDDRTTRLAAVALAWNVFQHFYPYFDVVKTDWSEELRRALRSSATDADAAAFQRTLGRLVAALHDGHGGVYGGGGMSDERAELPLIWEWIENKLVITALRGEVPGLKRGDVVLKVDGKPAADVLSEAEVFISGATPQWKRYRALNVVRSGPAGASVTLEVQSADNPPTTVKLTRQGGGMAAFRESRPSPIAELKPGIFYVDLDRVKEQEFNGALEKLAAAKGIIFDLRGYPTGSTKPLSHLTDKPITCARWNIPEVVYPDRKNITFAFSNWTVAPQSPKFTGKIAFLTDGRAISYAETYLGIVENYQLAEIIGGPTAGTNGNVNPITLPGDYHVMWTGMKVLKHDGSRHHGVGIQPTIPMTRTIRGIADGKDEVLEKGIEIVSR